jgi:sterol desaturase/sphingolipid hydroxylase (fatty acid hydroxylase superfamily)
LTFGLPSAYVPVVAEPERVAVTSSPTARPSSRRGTSRRGPSRRGPSRRGTSLADAAREFGRHPTPWLLAAAAVGTVGWRVSLGGWGLADLAVVGAYLAVFPLIEWVLHTSLLHWRPRALGPFTLDPLVARKHREHHADPEDLELIFIPLPALLTAGAFIGLLAWVAPPPYGATFAAVAVVLGLVYEWVHYLVHTDYRPRSAPYRAIWRHHRLHHYKNEHYWFTVTTTSTADRLLGTQPAPNEVPTSPTARDLLGTGAAALTERPDA